MAPLPTSQAIVHWTMMMVQSAAGVATLLSFPYMNQFLQSYVNDFVDTQNFLTVNAPPVTAGQVRTPDTHSAGTTARCPFSPHRRL